MGTRATRALRPTAAGLLMRDQRNARVGPQGSDAPAVGVRMAVVARAVFYELIDHICPTSAVHILRSTLCLTRKDAD
jgi:hypothetical protein